MTTAVERVGGGLGEFAMAVQLDQISRLIGKIESALENLANRADEDRALGNHRHEENQAAIRGLTEKLELHSQQVEIVRGLHGGAVFTRGKLAALAAIGVSALALIGMVAKAVLKWGAGALMSHFK